MSKDRLKNCVASCLVIALGIILVSHFVLFWLYGGVFITENNRAVLCVETAMGIAVLLFGIERLVSFSRANKGLHDRFPLDTRSNTASPAGPGVSSRNSPEDTLRRKMPRDRSRHGSQESGQD